MINSPNFDLLYFARQWAYSDTLKAQSRRGGKYSDVDANLLSSAIVN